MDLLHKIVVPKLGGGRQQNYLTKNKAGGLWQ
jgi:hypothetical protein